MIEFFLALLRMSLFSAVTALCVIAVRALLRRLGAPALASYLLWAIVLLRMVCPTGLLPDSPISPLRPFSPAIDRGVAALEEIRTGTGAPQTVPSPAVAAPDGLPLPASSSVSGAPAPANVATLVWLAGLMVLWGVSLLSYLGLRRRVDLAVRRTVEGAVWYESDRVASPFVLGFAHPRIYLPLGMAPEARGYVLCHEQAHISHRDDLVKAFAFLALTVHWFNPILWISWGLFCRDMELACDEQVFRNTPASDFRKGYSAALLSLATERGPLAPLAFGETGVRERIRRALHYRKPALWLLITAGAVLLVTLGAFFTHPIFPPLPDRPPALHMDENSWNSINAPAELCPTDWNDEHLDSRYPENVPGKAATIYLQKPFDSVHLSFEGKETPDVIEAVDYLLLPGQDPSPMPVEIQGLNGVDCIYFMEPHTDSTGAGMEQRILVLTCRWASGSKENTCQYAFLIEVPSIKAGVPLHEPVVVAGRTRITNGETVALPYGTYVSITQPRGRNGTVEKTLRLLDLNGDPVDTIEERSSLYEDQGSASGSPLRPRNLPEGDERQPDQTQEYILHYTWEDDSEEVFTYRIYATAPPPG